MEITLEKISKAYEGKPVLRDISLQIRDHSLTTLLGPSGCGKTTLLRILAGLETPDGGDIFLGDRCVCSCSRHLLVPPEKRGMGFVFQDFALWPHMTVFENVAFGLRAQSRTEHLKETVKQALSLVALQGLEDRYPSQLSGGQQQRVAFARAIVLKPECILFDEPLSALDALLRVQMRQELRRLVTQLGITAVFVTYDQEEAMSISDAIAVLQGGAIEQLGTPQELYDSPRTLFTAQFIGKGNWLDDHTLFRPEKASRQPLPGARAFETRVTGCNFLGHTWQLQLNWQGREWTWWNPAPEPLDTPLTLYVPEDSILTIGKEGM